MKMRLTVFSIFLFCLLSVMSCYSIYSDEPQIAGEITKYFGGAATTQCFQVQTFSGKPYNHRIDWIIKGIYEYNLHGENALLEDRVDTLSNGDMVISYDWASFRVPKEKTWVEVALAENTTGKERSLLFDTNGLRMGGPWIIVVQHPIK